MEQLYLMQHEDMQIAIFVDYPLQSAIYCKSSIVTEKVNVLKAINI